jgi:hypothetical protein
MHLSNYSVVGIGRMMNAMIDDKLGAFELHSSITCIIIYSIHPAKDIRQWLAAPDSSRNQHEARDKRQVDTCAWFLEGERFRMWQEDPGFLWVKGKCKFLHSSILNLLVQHL